KTIDDADIEAIIMHNSAEEVEAQEQGYQLDWFSVHTSNFTTATSTVSLIKDGEKYEAVALGDGPVDSSY
ncbi:alpha-isopropylmalate synthase regulatory domain-containing protein, partial [Acinetobacter sp. 163]|nr:alpha-isopropylmalate synthase regulatory domain-containing protein [Acinetobacter sp. 163]